METEGHAPPVQERENIREKQRDGGREETERYRGTMKDHLGELGKNYRRGFICNLLCFKFVGKQAKL